MDHCRGCNEQGCTERSFHERVSNESRQVSHEQYPTIQYSGGHRILQNHADWDDRNLQPPEPPDGRYDLWDLQWCKWWGWTWVRKADAPNMNATRKVESASRPPQRVESRSQSMKSSSSQVIKKKKTIGETFCPCCFSKPKPVERQKKRPSPEQDAHGRDCYNTYSNIVLQCQCPSSPEKHGKRPPEIHDGDDIHSRDYYNTYYCNVGRHSSHAPPPHLAESCCRFSSRTCGETPSRIESRMQVLCCECKSAMEKEPSACCICENQGTKKKCSACGHPFGTSVQSAVCPPQVTIVTTQTENPAMIQRSIGPASPMDPHSSSAVGPCSRCQRPVCCACQAPTPLPAQVTAPAPAFTPPPATASACCHCGRPSCPSGGHCCPKNRQVMPYTVNMVKVYENNPFLTEMIKIKATDYASAHKPFSLLMKNNYRLMKLLTDKKSIFSTSENLPKPIDTIPSTTHSAIKTPSDNDLQRKDHEHCKILTAVCDAILSNHTTDSQFNEVPETLRKFGIFSRMGISKDASVQSEVAACEELSDVQIQTEITINEKKDLNVVRGRKKELPDVHITTSNRTVIVDKHVHANLTESKSSISKTNRKSNGKKQIQDWKRMNRKFHAKYVDKLMDNSNVELRKDKLESTMSDTNFMSSRDSSDDD